MNRLEAMQTFVRVAELGSFTRAAEALGLPKASVSTAVQQLEAALGTRLLHRTTRRVGMTQDGRVFHERARDLLDDMEELQSLFRQGGQALRGRLRVDMSSGLARNFILPRLPQFLEAHPGLELELSSTDRRVDLVREGFDCVLRVGTLADSSLIARPLGAFRIANCASPAYLRRHGTPQALEDLASHRLIHYVPNLGARPDGFEYRDGEGYRSLPMAGALTVNNAESYQGACLAGLGIIQAPAAGVQHLLAQGSLVELLPQLRAEPMPVSLLYANRRNLPRRVQAFMDWAAATLQPHLDPLM
ncbi:LysR family transcriptional regulator [Solimonas sp. K1W22B-7]|uniref:LysR family transcriptional regulator n=1 Tax=Solimonas sp. K1W22B-7 TaxID=2303331 RepID=UPI000E335224|nr:LysR family transcriptional regulator [Solimonas sp. K1W22B-7]AXQ28339.1 LysR family transcriptional regulator [Solimonas sp. K1W22B-7]